MKRLPPFCSSDDLVIPHIPDNVRVALEDISPDALDTIETLGVPCSWRITFEANETLELSSVVATGSPLLMSYRSERRA